MKHFIAAACLAASSVFAANLTPDAPMAQFKGKDQALFDEALYATLDKGADGDERKWSNPETKASGRVKAMRSFQRDGNACRTVAVANKAGGRTSSASYNFCRSAAGKWTLAQ